MVGSIRRLLSKRGPGSTVESQIVDAFLEHSAEMLAFTDETGRITSFSKTLDAVLTRGDGSGMPVSFYAMLDEKSRYAYEKILTYVRREQKAIVDFRAHACPDSDLSEITLTVVPIPAFRSHTVSILHIIGDRRPISRSSPNLGQMEKLSNVGQIAAGMAHELNTPLGSIILSAEHIKESIDDPDLSDEAARIKSRAEHCSKVVRELLGYVHRDELLCREHILVDIVNKVIDLVSAEARRRDINLTVNRANGNISVCCNENQIEQVLFNLITNAYHAIGTSGEVTLSFAHDPLLNRVLLIVDDNGKGISPDDLDRIFEPFFTTKPGGQGTGLGLALCKKIALEHGGDIRVRSRQGAGATFEVALPVAQ
ncbi:MAG TPA: HAMP domain-containing sensor histidine kinase [Candidatus Deferrimicrobium sp.]|nr:HAMP domain-containing sensor histidine kinase [Candidatus Deferrimicrobium sp.]